jgi:hypothetical protein
MNEHVLTTHNSWGLPYIASRAAHIQCISPTVAAVIRVKSCV